MDVTSVFFLFLCFLCKTLNDGSKLQYEYRELAGSLQTLAPIISASDGTTRVPMHSVLLCCLLLYWLMPQT